MRFQRVATLGLTRAVEITTWLRSKSSGIAARKAFTIRSGIITETGIVEVMWPLRIVASIVMGIALACLPSVVITLVLGGLRATEYVVVIVAGSSEPSIRVERIIEERMEEWPPARWSPADAQLGSAPGLSCLPTRSSRQGATMWLQAYDFVWVNAGRIMKTKQSHAPPIILSRNP